MERGFADTLAELRRRRGLSQRAVAADMKISQALLSHYENGAREPGLSFVTRACDYYGVSADYILGRAGFEDSRLPGGLGEAVDMITKLAEDLAEPEYAELMESAGRYMAAAASKARALASGTEPVAVAELSVELQMAELDVVRADINLETE